MFEFTGVNHLAMVTADMESTIRFWRDVLGLRLVAGLGNPGYRHYFFELTENDMLAFFEWDGAEPVPAKDHGAPVRGPISFDHVSLGVRDDDELWKIRERLEGAGFWVSEMVDHGFIHSLYSFDPNDIPIEFSANVPGIDVRVTPIMVDANPVDAALEGAAPVRGHWPESVVVPENERRIYKGAGAEIARAMRDK